MDDDRDKQFSIGSLREYASVLEGGRRFHVTPERVEISDASGAVIQTIEAHELTAVSRHNTELTLTRQSGDPIELTAASTTGARWLAGILAVNPHISMSSVETPLASREGAPRALLGVIAFAAIFILIAIVVALLSM